MAGAGAFSHFLTKKLGTQLFARSLSTCFLLKDQQNAGSSGVNSFRLPAFLRAGVSGILSCATIVSADEESEHGLECPSYPWPHKGILSSYDHASFYSGHPKDLGPSRVIHFTSERQFIQILHEGRPVVVAFTIKCPYTKHFDDVLEEAAAEFYPNIKFVRVECPKYPGFCVARQRKEYPFIEIFHNPEEATNQAKVADPNITKYSVKVLPFNYDLSAYGFREFFKKHDMYSSNSS